MRNHEAAPKGGPASALPTVAPADRRRNPVVPSRSWIRLDAQLARSLKVSRLSDAEFRAYIATLCEGKAQPCEGTWPSAEHWAHTMRQVLALAHDDAALILDALVAKAFMEVAQDGSVAIHDWDDWQPKDPTAAERAARHRAKQRQVLEAARAAVVTGRGVTRDVTQTRLDVVDEDKTSATVTPDGQEAADAAERGWCRRCKQPIAPGDAAERWSADTLHWRHAWCRGKDGAA